MSVYDVAAVDRLNRLRHGNSKERKGEAADMSSPSFRKRRPKSSLDEAREKADSLRKSMNRHKESLSRPDSPKSQTKDETQSLHGDDVRKNYDDETRSLYSDDIRRLRNDDTRSLHSDDIRRMHDQNARRLHNDDIPRLQQKQRLQQLSHHRQSFLSGDESDDRYHRRPDPAAGYRTVSSSRPRSSVMEHGRNDSFQETKRSLRNSQRYMDEADFQERPRSQQYRGYSAGPKYDRDDEFFDLEAHRYPRLSNGTLPNNMRLHGSNQRGIESFRESQEHRESQENLYESHENPAYGSRHHQNRRSHTPTQYESDIGSYESSFRRPQRDYHESERDYQSLQFAPFSRSARSSQRNSPNRQSNPRYIEHGSGYMSDIGPCPPFSNSTPISRRSSRNGSPIHSIHSSRDVSPESSVHSYRERAGCTNQPFDHPSHIKRQYTPSHSQTPSARSSRATSPCSSHTSSRSRVRESDWRAESVQPTGGRNNQNIGSQIEQYLMSTGHESENSQGGPAVIYVRETFKIINQGDQGLRQLSQNGNHNNAQLPSPSVYSHIGTQPQPQFSQKPPFPNTFTSTSSTNGYPLGTGAQERALMENKQQFKKEESCSREGNATQMETSHIPSDAANEQNVREINSSTPVAWKNIDEKKNPSTDFNKQPIFEPNMARNIDNSEDIKGKIEENTTPNLPIQNNDWIDKDAFWCKADQLLGFTDGSNVKNAGELAQKEFEPSKNSEKSDKSKGAGTYEPVKPHIEEDCRSIGTQDSLASTTLDKKVTVHLSADDLKSANVSITDRSSLERLLDSLSVRVQQIEGEHGDQVADLADLDDSARAESVTSLISSESSKGRLEQLRHNQEASGGKREGEAHSTIRRQSVIIEGLTMETDELRRKCLQLEDKLEHQGDTAPLVDDLSNKLHKVESKLEDSESYCYQVVEENVELKTEMEALEAEISEVQDTFRDKDAKEFKKVKWELENLSKTCRNLQIKLGKAQAKATRLRQEKEEIEEHQKEQMLWKTTAVVAAAALATFQLMRQFK